MAKDNNCVAIFGFPYISDWILIEFQDEVPLYRRCVLCGMVSSKMNVLRCRETVCQPCVDSMKNDDNSFMCPFHHKTTSVEEFHVDETAAEELGSYNVYCPNKPQGCKHVGLFKTLQNHMVNCKYLLVKCQMCGADIARCDIYLHVISECKDYPLYMTHGKCKLIAEETKRFVTREQMIAELEELRNAVDGFQEFKKNVALEKDSLMYELDKIRDEVSSFKKETIVNISDCFGRAGGDSKSHLTLQDKVSEMEMEIESLKNGLTEYSHLMKNFSIMEEQVQAECKTRKLVQKKHKDTLSTVVKKLDDLQTKLIEMEQRESETKEEDSPAGSSAHQVEEPPICNPFLLKKTYYCASTIVNHGICYTSPYDKSEAAFQVDLRSNVFLHELLLGEDDCRFGIQCSKMSSTNEDNVIGVKLYVLKIDCARVQRWVRNKTVLLEVRNAEQKMVNCRKMMNLQILVGSDSIRFLRNDEYMYCATSFKYSFTVNQSHEILNIKIKVMNNSMCSF